MDFASTKLLIIINFVTENKFGNVHKSDLRSINYRYPEFLEEPGSYWLSNVDHPMRCILLSLKEVTVNDWMRHPETSDV